MLNSSIIFINKFLRAGSIFQNVSSLMTAQKPPSASSHMLPKWIPAEFSLCLISGCQKCTSEHCISRTCVLQASVPLSMHQVGKVKQWKRSDRIAASCLDFQTLWVELHIKLCASCYAPGSFPTPRTTKAEHNLFPYICAFSRFLRLHPNFTWPQSKPTHLVRYNCTSQHNSSLRLQARSLLRIEDLSAEQPRMSQILKAHYRVP